MDDHRGGRALDDVEDLMADGTLKDATTVLGLLLARRALDVGDGP